jgi:peptidoglycan/xylan/chitin deacetylase (PgdA/CDA1 family)
MAARMGHRRVQGRTLILAYHNVVSPGHAVAGDPALHLPVDELATQLDHLMEVARIIPLASLADRPEAEPDERPRAVVTFDDAYRGALTLGLAELRARELPATFFVAPGILGDRTLWWDGLGAGDTGEAGGLRDEALTLHAGRQRSVIRWARTRGLPFRRMPPERRTVTEAELLALDGLPGITFGSHGWRHPSLPRVPAPELHHELDAPRRWLGARLSSAIPWLAYPYGHTSHRVRRRAEALGYVGSLRVDGGWADPRPSHLFELPRLAVPAGLSMRGFQARLAGFLCRP